jgi:hypothetical protein
MTGGKKPMIEIKIPNTNIAFIVENPLFELGDILINQDAIDKLGIDNIVKAIQLHVRGEWGNLSEKDKATNEMAIICGGSILSSYLTKSGTEFYVTTDLEKPSTTFVLT